SADEGGVVWRSGIRVSYLSQDEVMNEAMSIKETLFQQDNMFLKAIDEYNKAMENPSDSNAYQKALDKMEALQAWDYEAKYKQVLGALGLYELDQKIGKLSGGQKKRLGLAKVLMEEPDFL